MEDIAALLGKTLVSIRGGVGSDEVLFTTEANERYHMYHQQDCCENVYLEDIAGDTNDLIGTPIVSAYKETNSDIPREQEYNDDSFTWTFYRMSTVKGTVVFRWYGESNGYYSEEVDVIKETADGIY